MNVAEKGINRFNFNAIDKNHKLRSAAMHSLSFLPDRVYLEFLFYIRNRRRLNLTKPVTFCDKMNWLKLHNKREEYTQLVDKLAVRAYIDKKIGEGHLFPLLGSWGKFEDISWEELPNRFVLKCNHDSGSVKIIDDKAALSERERQELRSHFDRHVNRNPFFSGREYPYKDVKPCILAEEFMESTDGKGINDYKFFCCNGKPEVLFVATERRTDVRFDFYDMEFNHLDIVNIHPQSGKTIEKPACFEEMKEIAAKLSEGMPFVRIDLYEINGVVYFGEFTFFHAGGFWPLTPDEWEKKLGDLISLS